MKFFQEYVKALKHILAMTIAFGSGIVPLVLCMILNSLWWLLLYILFIPLFAAIMAYMEGI